MANTAERRSIATGLSDEEAALVGFDRPPQTELGRLLVAARLTFLEAEGQFLTEEELEREIAERRGGVSWDDEE